MTFRSLMISLMAFNFLSCDSLFKSDDSSDSTTEIGFVNLRVENVTGSRAVVKFDTSVPTTCEAEYGVSVEALDLTATDPSMEENQFELDHEIPLEDLSPLTTYYYRARATDASGNTARSETLSFTTAEAAQTDLGTNLAINASVTSVSSNFGGAANDETWGIINAIDGSQSTEWSTNGDGDNASFTLDFGEDRTLKTIRLRSRKMTDGSSIISSFKLTLADASELGPYETPDPDQLYTFEVEPPVVTQTIRFDAVTTTGGNTGLKEIQFFE